MVPVAFLAEGAWQGEAGGGRGEERRHVCGVDEGERCASWLWLIRPGTAEREQAAGCDDGCRSR